MQFTCGFYYNFRDYIRTGHCHNKGSSWRGGWSQVRKIAAYYVLTSLFWKLTSLINLCSYVKFLYLLSFQLSNRSIMNSFYSTLSYSSESYIFLQNIAQVPDIHSCNKTGCSKDCLPGFWLVVDKLYWCYIGCSLHASGGFFLET